MMFNTILVVCTGNICRSPVGERYLRQFFPDKKITSAGLRARVGHEADPVAANIAARYGLSLKGHRGRQFTADMGEQADLILVMEKLHFAQIEQMAPLVRGKTLLFGHWTGLRDIPDPFLCSDAAFLAVHQMIVRAGLCWVEKLSEEYIGEPL